MRESALLMMRGDKLQPELAAALEGGEAGAIYEVHVHKASAEDAAYFLETRAKVQDGLADIEAGEVLDSDEVHAELEEKFGITIRR
ncbi:MAG: hypothetical protein HQL33_02360 [Alphaproteobacteria bacterium]|nr:hypothetical protein [Alphaproteobacteria bacterium]MBF0128815.1 hypothetical protein [Alphaproteobacteria bacterium]